MTVLLWAFIYPGIGLLAKWLSPSYTSDSTIDCQILPAELVGSIFLGEVILMYIWIALLPIINNAVFLMLYGAFGFFSIGSVFFLLTHVILFCPPVTPEIFSQYPAYMGLMLFLSIMIFVIHIKPRTQRTIDLNKKKIDFSKMIFSMEEVPIHISQKASMRMIAILAVSVSFIGLGMARLIGGFLGQDYKTAAFIVLLIFLSYMMLGYLMLIQLYSAWFVYKRSKIIGKKMTIKEFDL